MKFANVIGHEDIKTQLSRNFYENRISHAYIFYGISGIGKLSLAIAFSQFLSCTDKQENDSCGKCPSCIKYEKLIHPDLHFAFPTLSKNVSDKYIKQWKEFILTNPYFDFNDWMLQLDTENKQGAIYAEEATEIVKKLSLKTFESNYKIMIIWLPEKMNTSCANKLLKIIEEPPTETVFILVSNNREEVLPTILSRTQPVKIFALPNEILKSYLTSNCSLDEETAEDITKISGGSILQALKNINSSSENDFSQFMTLMRIVYGRKILEAIQWAEEMSKIGREKQKQFNNYCLNIIRENFVYNYNIDKISYITNEEATFAKSFAKFINSNNIAQIMKIFNDAYIHIERNANAKILFTDVALKLMKEIRK